MKTLIYGFHADFLSTLLLDIGIMIGAAGVGKTAYFLYPNLEYACASGMSFITSDTKGDLYRNYGRIAKEYYGYDVAVIDLRNPTRSDGNNLLHLVNKYMDLYKENPGNLSYKAKAEKYAKIISKTIILNGADSTSFGQNVFFYDAAEGLLTATILLIAEFCESETRHIVSVFKIIQDLLAPSGKKGKNQFQLLIDKLPSEHKAKWFAGAALNSAEQAMASVMSTTLSRLNAFLDSEMEQILCFDTAIDTEKLCNSKCAVFIVMPEEDSSKYFMVSLIVQQLYREILAVANEKGNRKVQYADKFILENRIIEKFNITNNNTTQAIGKGNNTPENTHGCEIGKNMDKNNTDNKNNVTSLNGAERGTFGEKKIFTRKGMKTNFYESG